jgi:hypothetical protein
MLIEIINYSQMKEQGVNNRGWRIPTSEGLTEIAQQQHMRRTKRVNNKHGKKADYINECYRKMLKIGKCKKVFQCVDGSQCELLRAKSKQKFLNAKKKLLLHYSCYVNTGAQKLTIQISKPTTTNKYCSMG